MLGGTGFILQDDNDVLRRSPGTPVFTAPECCLGQFSLSSQKYTLVTLKLMEVGCIHNVIGFSF